MVKKPKRTNSYSVFAKMLRSVLPAQIIAQLIPSVGILIKGIIAGNFLDMRAVAAIGFIYPLTTLILALAMNFRDGSTILAGRAVGKGDFDEANVVFSSSVAVAAITGLLCSVIFFFFADTIAGLLGASGSVLNETAAYIKGLSIGNVPNILYTLFAMYLHMNNKKNVVLIASGIMLFSDIAMTLFSAVILHAGILGFSLSASVSQYITLIIIIFYSIKEKCLFRFRLKNISVRVMLRILRFGIPVTLAMLSVVIRTIVYNTMTNSCGGIDAAVAAGVFFSSVGISDSFVYGVEATTPMIASTFAGRRDAKSLKSLLKFLLIANTVVIFVINSIYALLSHQIGMLYGMTGNTLILSVICISMYAIPKFMDAICVTLSRMMQVRGKIRYAGTISLVGYGVIPIISVFVLSPFLGLYGVWSMYGIGYFFTIVMIIIMLWINLKHFPK